MNNVKFHRRHALILFATGFAIPLSGCDMLFFKWFYGENTPTPGATLRWKGTAKASEQDLTTLTRAVILKTPGATMILPDDIAMVSIDWPRAPPGADGAGDAWHIQFGAEPLKASQSQLTFTSTFFHGVPESKPTAEAKRRLDAFVKELTSRGASFGLVSERGLESL